MQGGPMLSETLAQDSAQMMMETFAGRDQARRFLQRELDQYLFLRGSRRTAEAPFAQVEASDHIAYQKGPLVLHRLRDARGAEHVNAALRLSYSLPVFGPLPGRARST
jgi:aminopeptidase N